MIDNQLIIYDKNFKQKITKRNRNKKFTIKRRPYKSYNDAKLNWSDVFIEIDQLIIDKNKNNKIIIDNKEHREDIIKFLLLNKNLIFYYT